MVAVYLAFFFANWYSNGNEIPVDKDEAFGFLKQNWRMSVTMTNQWLMMNGCTTQPVQR